jgi:hypothetical protein
MFWQWTQTYPFTYSKIIDDIISEYVNWMFIYKCIMMIPCYFKMTFTYDKFIFKVGRINGISFYFYMTCALYCTWNSMSSSTRLDFVIKNNIIFGLSFDHRFLYHAWFIWMMTWFIWYYWLPWLPRYICFVHNVGIDFVLVQYLIYIPMPTIGSVPWTMNLYGFILNISILRYTQQPTTLGSSIRTYPFNVFLSDKDYYTYS